MDNEVVCVCGGGVGRQEGRWEQEKIERERV